MREMVHEAIAGAREFLGDVVQDLRGEARLSDDEALTVYETHRGNPFAILEFTQQRAPSGVDPLGAALEYEAAMESLLSKSRGA